MTAYIVDTQKFEITKSYPDSSYASFDMSDNYGWYPDNRYRMFHDEDVLYDYWHLYVEETGEFWEGRGVSENMKHDMFREWLDEEVH